MYVNPDTGAVVLVPPRTASRTIAAALMGAGWVADRGHHFVHPEVLARAPWVAVSVRNHWDQLASWYTSRPQRLDLGAWFDEWYGEDIIRSVADHGMGRYVTERGLYAKWLCHPSLHVVPELIRFENLAEDLEAATGVHLGGHRVSDRTSHRRGRHYSLLYTEQARHAVADRFADEIARLGYSFELVT